MKNNIFCGKFVTGDIFLGVSSAIPVNEVDKQLFRACTRVQLGNGNTAQFWESCWLDGRAPRDIAPLLYRLAWRKNLKVSDQLVNQCWTRGLWRMSTVEEMAQFVLLWDLVHGVVLNGEEAFTQQNLHMRYSSEVHTAPSNLVTSGRRMQSPSIVFSPGY